MIRAFLAFDIPGKVKTPITRLIADFTAKEKGVRWMDPEKMHVTMRFFGSVDEDLLMGDISGAIKSAVSGFKPAKLLCQGIGVFPDWKYPRVIWAGFSGETERVLDLHTALSNALAGFDLHEDKRRFRLHLTIGRAKARLKKSPLIDLVEKLGPVKFGEVLVDRLVLYKSLLTKNGPIYTPLREFVL